MTRLIRGRLLAGWLAVGFGVLWSAAAASPAASADSYWPGETWRTSTPERQGLDSAELARVFDFIKDNNVDFNSLIIVRNGYKVLEAYFYPFQRDLPHDIASVTKSVTSLLVGMAIERGYIKSVEAPALGFFPDIQPGNLDDRKKSLRIEHLLTMTSRFCHGYSDGESQPGAMRLSPDSVRFMLDQPLVTAPGRTFAYCSLAPHLLSAIITRATGWNELEFARKNLFGPLAIDRVEWPADAQGNSFGWGDLFLRPIDLAKIGHLLMSRGVWKGSRLVSEAWIRLSTRPHVLENPSTGYGYLWWLPLANPGLFEGRGRGGQRLIVWPRRSLLVVMLGNGRRDRGDVGAIIGRSLKSDSPLPENPEAVRVLDRKIREAESAPAPERLKPLPGLARTISGRIYSLRSNTLGVESVSFDFGTEDEAVLRLSVRDSFSRESSVRVIPLGLDGNYRFSNNSRFGLPLAARGSWASARELDVVLNEPANDRAYDIELRFSEDGARAELTISERTGLVEPTAIQALAQR